MNDRRAAEKARKKAKDLKRAQDKLVINENQTNLPEVVKLFHHLP